MSGTGASGAGASGATGRDLTGGGGQRGPRRLVRNLLLLAAACVLVLSGLSLLTLSGEEGLDRGTGRTGTAQVVACRRVGPISGSGLGYWWTCTLEVRWDDGGQGRYVLPGSRFTPADRDRPVPVRETARGDRGNLDVDTRPVRADRSPRIGLLAIGVLAFLAGGLCALPPVVGVVGALVRAVRRTREGTGQGR